LELKNSFIYFVFQSTFKMKKPEEELAEIKSMMERSTRFLSLSGLSGVLAGLYAIAGAGIAWYWLYFPYSTWGNESFILPFRELLYRILFLALSILVAAVASAFLFSRRKSIQKTEPFWNPASRRFSVSLFVPVILGGLFSFSLLHEGAFQLIPACTLLFYGLGLSQAASFTLGEIKQLGWAQLALGVLAAFVPSLGLLFWAIGFGILHILYGAMMYYRHER
jgi:hypothetical protein